MARIKYNDDNTSWESISIYQTNPASEPLPIVKGGTGANTAETALSNLGGIPASGGTLTGTFDVEGQLNLNDNSLKYQGFSVPVVIESGTSNIWTYRKWSDGVLECWGNYEYNFNANTAHTAWGGVYYITDGIPSISYPVAFKSLPTVTAFAYNNGTTGAYWVAARANGTVNATPPLYMLRGNSNASAGKFVISYQVRGRWK